MIYLSGHVRAVVAQEPHFGFLISPHIGNRIPAGATWAADTGCYKHPESFNGERYLRWLERKAPRETCLFANAPDLYPDPQETLRRALPVLPRLRNAGWTPGFVAQDGATINDIPWDDIGCLFIGGTPEWKVTYAASSLIQEARRRGKQAHVGKVNEPERLQFAARAGATSVDGTKLAFGFDANWPELREWVRCINAQQSFFSAGE